MGNALNAHTKTGSALVQISIRVLANIARQRNPINLRCRLDPRTLRLWLL
jgi:hypothetical protein